MVIVFYHHCFITQLSIKRRIPSHRNRRQGSSAETKRFALNTTHTHIFTLPILGQTLFNSYFKESLQLLSCQVVMTSLHRIWRWYKATILTAWRSQCWYFTVYWSSCSVSADIQQKDREVLELLQERVTLFSDLAEVMGGYEVMQPSCSRNLFRAESSQALRGEQLLTQAITEGKTDRMLHLWLKQGVPPA